MSCEKITNYFQSKKRPHDNDDCGTKAKIQKLEKTVAFVQKGKLSPRKIKIKEALEKLEKSVGNLKEIREQRVKSPGKPIVQHIQQTDKKVIAKRRPAFERLAHLTSKTLPAADKLIDTATTPAPVEKSVPKVPAPPVELPLPASHRRLYKLFIAVDTIIQILSSRKEVITFEKLKPSVLQLEKCATLKEIHLGQMKTILPDCFLLKREKIGKQYELIVEVDGTPDYVGRRRAFERGLRNNVLEEHHQHLMRLDPPLEINKELITRFHPTFNIEKVAISYELPPHPINTLVTAKDLLQKANKVLCEQDKDIIVVRTKKEAVKELKGVSMKLIEKIRQREALKTASILTKPPDSSKKLLPQLSLTIRNIFTTEQKSALSLDLIVDRVMHSIPSCNTRDATMEQISLLCSTAPGFIKILKLSSGDYVKIDLNFEIKSL